MSFKINSRFIFTSILLSVFNFFMQAQTSSLIMVNEYSTSNLSTVLDNYGHHEDWIELYNADITTVDLSGFYLSDDPEEPDKWAFPDGTSMAPGSFIRVWTSGRNLTVGQNYHAAFKLTQTRENPEYIVFSNPTGEIIEEILIEITQKDHSRGRVTNGSETWGIFTQPTPNISNNSSVAYPRYTLKPTMSYEAGFYDGPIAVAITTDEPNAVIRYTIDGSEPTASSPLYSLPVDVVQTTIINARVFSNDSEILPGLIDFNTYFIDVSHNMGVVSASSETLDNLLNGNSSLRPFGTFEYFNEEGERTTYGYGEYNEHGQDSWVHDQRSIDYIMRDECGYNYAIRDQIIPLTDRDEFQRIILRAAGDDNYPGIDTSAHLRDFLTQNMAEKNHMHLDVRKGQKGVLYVNGIYWGVYGFREKVNDHDFTEYYYNQGKYDIYYLMLWDGSWAEYGGQDAWNDWNEIHDFILYNNMAVQENFEYVKTRYDYQSLVDYVLINSFVVCSDWINWNVGWWKGTNPLGGHRKWGYVLWDEDATFNHYINYTGVPGTTPYVSPCFPEGLYNDPEDHIQILNALIDNDEFRQYYVSRYIDLYNSAFQPDRWINYLDTIETRMAPEMPNHVQRWGGNVNQWQNNVQKIRNFINARYGYLPDGLSDCYNLTGPYALSFYVEPTDAGEIQVNSLTINESPWNGHYFGGIDILLGAIETNGIYEFDYWELENHAVEPSDTLNNVVLNLEQPDVITAHFKLKTFADSLVINEINYNSADYFDPGDWVEFFNPNDYDLDISGWYFKDNDDTHLFVFPDGTVVAAQDYLVLCRDTADFSNLFPEVQNFTGEMDFGLSSDGELIRLFNFGGALIDTVHFGVENPWPPEPNGGGSTLELINWTYDNALPESWVASVGNGTPGEENGTITFVDQAYDAVQEVHFSIYPNPAKNLAYLQVTSQIELKEGRISIFDVFGNLLREIPVTGIKRIELDLQGLQAGVYFCKLSANGNKNFRLNKMIVE
ncbi:MAG: lamin tail domain-containing protein [Bacteroidales bacterium]|nr:lamin tail domain-containing protein [Bacteroidales bacterium]